MTNPTTLSDLIPAQAVEAVEAMDVAQPLTLEATGLPTKEDAKQLSRQYQKAIQGLYEAYKFGEMLAQVANVLSRENISQRGRNSEGQGLKGWLSEHCPEVNYKTAMKFLQIARKTSEALPEEAREDEAAVREYLEGKSQREVLAPKEAEAPKKRHALSAKEQAAAELDVFSGFLTRLEQHVRTGASKLLLPEDRREVIIRVKQLAKALEDEARG